MIRIRNPQLEEWASSLHDDFFVKEGYKDILENYMEGDHWNKTQKDLLKYLYLKSREIISGRPSQLAETIKYISKNFPKEHLYNIQMNQKIKDCQFKNALKHVFNYDNFIKQYDISKWGAYTLTERLKVAVCPYCNRQFTTTYQSSDGRTRPQLDHFFDKATYPYLAVSFFNLIPSCYVCNANLKGTKAFTLDTHLHPYEDGFEQYRTFTIKFDEGIDIDYVGIFEGNVKGFSIGFKDNPIIDKEDPIWMKIDNNCKTFKLVELYNAHKDYASDLLIKSKIYNDDQIKNLLVSFPDLFQNESEVARLVLGTFPGSELESSDRVLSKFTQDILMELKTLAKY
ncbi:hypothetical protein [Paenibacillus sp. A3M_27_13]|uniref:hypothetical protein n=1 Tax=Paenibacillus sp. A3M_27_13 TaxID=2962029 RepID=UPI0020B812DB|nr:hypothetical protein [Paenibacillus sp. A3M_27_13]